MDKDNPFFEKDKFYIIVALVKQGLQIHHFYEVTICDIESQINNKFGGEYPINNIDIGIFVFNDEGIRDNYLLNLPKLPENINMEMTFAQYCSSYFENLRTHWSYIAEFHSPLIKVQQVLKIRLVPTYSP